METSERSTHSNAEKEYEEVVVVDEDIEPARKKTKTDNVEEDEQEQAPKLEQKLEVELEQDHEDNDDNIYQSKSYSPPGLIDLEKLEQIYNLSDSEHGENDSDYTGSNNSDNDSDNDSDNEENNLEPWQEEIVDEMEKSLEYSPSATEDPHGNQLINLSKDESSKIRTDLWKHGPIKFMDKYTTPDCNYSPEHVLAALGFRLPIDFVAKYSGEQLNPFLRLAIRHTLSSRQRLPYPHTLNDLCKVLKDAKKIIVLTGAGISTSLGIPDFRSESGLYNKLAHLGLSDPQEVFDIALFREDPSIFYSVAKDILPETTHFSPTHAFIRLLQDKGILLRNYTQNIDNLESYAGIDRDKLVQCHGSFATATCVTCGYKTKGEDIFSEIRQQKVPNCPECSIRLEKERQRRISEKSKNGSSDDDDYTSKSEGILKPDITFFGEALPNQFEELLLGGDAHDCDLLICIGTSLKVAPVSEIVRIIPPDIPQIYISKTAVHHNEFDITFLGSCDDAVELIVEKMGWELRHDMVRRHTLDAKEVQGSDDLVYPDGRIIFEDDEAVYRFEDNNNSSSS